MKLPPIADPHKYAGLYVYDFGTHVSVGYTAKEVGILRESKEHRSGTAYEIYRVTEEGGFELRGVLDDRLGVREAMCFLRADGAAARCDYDELREAAKGNPAPRAGELHLAKLYDLSPPNVTALLYDSSATSMMATWLASVGYRGGDRVIAGTDVHAMFTGSEGLRIDSCTLPALVTCHDRPADEVLRTVEDPLQR